MLKDNKVNLISLAPYLDIKSKDYKPKIKEKTENTCKLNGGKLISLPTFSDGSTESSVWGGPNQWKSASLSTASYITAIHDDYDSIILFAHDTIFSSVRKYVPNLKKLKMIWIPHSLGSAFKDKYSDDERLSIEKESIEFMERSDKDVISYIGNYFKYILCNEYGVNRKKLIPLISGIYRRSTRFNINPSSIDKNIENNKIPLNKKIIFCWGRCVYQKGYDVLIPAYGKFLRDNPDYHLVLLMPTETSIPEYVEGIRKQISILPEGSVTAIYKFQETLPYSLLNYPKLDIVLFPSRFEGAPLTPLEALSFTKSNVTFVYSPIPQHLEIFQGIDRAISLKDLTVDSLSEGINLAVKRPRSLVKESTVIDFVESYIKGLNAAMKVDNES